MSAARTVARILALVPWLIERPGASVDEAAEAFGVDRRTVLRDLDTVGYCGLPGLGGGDLFDVTVVEDRIIVTMADELRRPLRPTPQEALRLLLAGESVHASLPRELPTLRSALDKVRAAIDVPAGVSIRLEDDGTIWLDDLRRAIETGRRVAATYRGRQDESPIERRFDPRMLHVAHGRWYVQGRDAEVGEERTFRLDRIAALDVLDDPAELGDAEPVHPLYEPGPEDVKVVLVLESSARWLAEQLRPDEIREMRGGRRRVVFRTDAIPWVRSLVLSAAPAVRVDSPASLRESVRDEARRAAALYGVVDDAT
jgi:proteasome accessory factor C